MPAWTFLVPLAPTASAQEEVPSNVLRNGDFERGGAWDGPTSRPSNWYPLTSPVGQTGVETAHESATSHNGSRSVYIGREVGEAGRTYFYQEVDAWPGVTFPFGVWTTASLGTGAHVEIALLVYDRYRNEVQTETVVLEDDFEIWVELRGTITFEMTATRVRFECALVGDGRAWFDDAYLGTPTDMDNAPLIVSVPPLEAAVGHAYNYRLRAVDLERDDFRYELVMGPEGMEVTEEGLLTWTPGSLAEDAVRVVVAANDTKGHAGYQDFFVQVLARPRARARSLNVLLYGSVDDHVNAALANESMKSVLGILDDHMRMSHPTLLPKWTLLLDGANANVLSDATGGPWKDLLDALDRSIGDELAHAMDLGYSAHHEPVYGNNPVYSSDPDPTWSDVVLAMDGLLSRRRDPLTGADEGGLGAGGLVAVGELGDVVMVAGPDDAAQLHALSKHDTGSVLVSLEEGPLIVTTPVEREELESLHAMLGEDPDAPRAVYWRAGRLVVGYANDGQRVRPLDASEGPDALNATLSALDPDQVHVVPIRVGGPGLYCNGSRIVDGWYVDSPTSWAYEHPDDPTLPVEGVRTREERDALLAAIDESITWLKEEFYDMTFNRSLTPAFLNADMLTDWLDPGTGEAVPAAELASAAYDLLNRRVELRYPSWDGVSWGFCRGDYSYFSLAEAYGLLVRALAAYEAEGALPATVEPLALLGPMEDAPAAFPYQSVRLADVVAEAAEVAEAVAEAMWRVTPRAVVPSSSSPGGVGANAMEFLLLMAEAYLVLHEGGGAPGSLLYLPPTHQWPLTLDAMERGVHVRFPGESWTVRPASVSGSLDTAPPYVLRVEPAPSARSVRLDANVTVYFSERMDEARPLTGALTLDPPVEGTVRWAAHRLVLDPDEPLEGNTTYTARVDVGLTDVAGNPMPAPFTWSFTTISGENLDPVLHPSPNVSRVEVLENGTLRLSVEVEDDGPPPITYRWLLDGAVLRDETGPAIVYAPGYEDEGEHRVTVVVQDGFGPPGTATHAWTVDVVNVNLPPRLVRSEPSAGPVSVVEGEGATLVLRVVAVDPDEGFLTYAWEVDGGSPPPEAVSEGGAALSFAHGFDSAGEHSISCRVADRQGVGFDVAWDITVEDVNRPPVVTGTDPLWTTSVVVGKAARLRVNATDPDGDALDFRWHVDGTEAARTPAGDWNYTSQRVGGFAVNVSVLDGRGGSAEATFLVEVLPLPDRPDPGGDDATWAWALLLIALAAVAAFVAWTELRRRRMGTG